ncbi:uncharacterized protein LODBEIA_P35460 [Lodderomyces beijingensis]|uniref:WD repeat protein mio zinc-ribbon like domain-containing protein n=1 Tax=Lodderomyces beijingensis TaxID=1775926 RepID=A0ABP0ZPQ4_9ASCO
MAGSIVRAFNWDDVYEQQFIAVTPSGSEVILYQTNHEDPSVESNSMIQLQSRSGFDNLQCSSYSNTRPGTIAVGSINGTVSIFDIKTPGSSIVNLRPKQNRPCNSITFNRSNLLVAGFDKGRQDNSLQIWDVEESSSKDLVKAEDESRVKKPVASFLPNEAVLSATFLPDTDTNVLCGSYKFLREIDLRADQPIFQMATKCTLGLMVDPFQTHLFQSHGEDGSLCIWDRRMLTSSQKSRGSTTGGLVVTETPILQFNKLLSDSPGRKIQNPCVRYSSIRRGEFSSIFNGDLIRRWHTSSVPACYGLQGNGNGKVTTTTTTTAASSSPFPSAATTETAAAENTVTGSLKKQASQLYRNSDDSLFVSMVLDVKTDYEKVISFDYSPDITSHTSTNFVCMRQSGSVFRMPVVESIEALDFNPFNEFSIAGPEGTSTDFILDDSQKKEASANKFGDGVIPNQELRRFDSDELDLELDMREVSTADDEENELDRPLNMYDVDFAESPLTKLLLDPSKVIRNDICLTIRKRAMMGYGTDPEKNGEIVEKLDPEGNQLSLHQVWQWLCMAKKSLEKGTMVSEGIDLGFQGISGIWSGSEALNNQKRSMTTSTTITEPWYAQAVKNIIASKGKKYQGINIPVDSEKKAQRKLCLIVSGWYLTEDEFEKKLQLLISGGYVAKAAGWAVFHGKVPKAIEILGSSKKENYQLMATAVAGYLAYKDSHVNSPWKDQCRKMASELEDPYLRAIFAFIADDDWWDVLDEHSLPLRERIGVAVRHLSDRDLTVYLNRLTDTVVNKGDLEGLILTGITPRGIDLLQSYVDRTSDVQTVALISVFSCPRYFVDDRVKHWVDCYRNMLNSWGMFNVRARLDVARTKLSKNVNGQVSIQATPKQFFLKCIRCNKNISKPKSSAVQPGFPNNQALLKQFNKSSNKSNGGIIITSCPHCGAALPRCSICLMSLGSDVPLENSELNKTDPNVKIENKFKNWFSFCLTCNHCYHASHAEEWFSKHYTCPAPDCDCRCNSK